MWAVDGHDYWEGLGDAKIAAALGWKSGETAAAKASTVATNEDGEAEETVGEGKRADHTLSQLGVGADGCPYRTAYGEND